MFDRIIFYLRMCAMRSDFYKHMPREDNSTVSTGTVSVRVKPGVSVYAVAQALATECRIPERAVLQPVACTINDPAIAREMDHRGREVTFPLVWQRTSDEMVEEMRRRITTVLFRLGPDVIEEIIKVEVLSETQVKANEATREAQQTPLPRLHQPDVA
jgi:hypothetical protein